MVEGTEKMTEDKKVEESTAGKKGEGLRNLDNCIVAFLLTPKIVSKAKPDPEDFVKPIPGIDYV